MPHEIFLAAPALFGVLLACEIARYGREPRRFWLFQIPLGLTALAVGSEGAFAILVDLASLFPKGRSPYLFAVTSFPAAFLVFMLSSVITIPLINAKFDQ